jgi:hypothetical protein
MKLEQNYCSKVLAYSMQNTHNVCDYRVNRNFTVLSRRLCVSASITISSLFGYLRFMNAAKRPVTTSLPSEARTLQRNASRPKRISYSGARQAIAFESSVKITVNLLLAIVAATTIAKLVPYYQSQQNRLATLQASVKVAERNNAELRSQFNRNFDPAQAARIMQEQSGMSYPNQKKVIWQTPSAAPSETSSNSPFANE